MQFTNCMQVNQNILAPTLLPLVTKQLLIANEVSFLNYSKNMTSKPKERSEYSKAQTDIYDEEFYSFLQLARVLLPQIPKPSDQEICKKWISKLLELKSGNAAVKKHRNSFFRYLLEIMRKAGEGICTCPKCDSKEKDYISRWSEDKRTYIAAKPLPGEGTLIYMAVCKDPSLGWDHK